jgi:hypothetical protein
LGCYDGVWRDSSVSSVLHFTLELTNKVHGIACDISGVPYRGPTSMDVDHEAILDRVDAEVLTPRHEYA